MVITPTLRGLFGISIDAQTKTITVNPHLPGGWKDAEVRNIQVPGGNISLDFARDGDHLVVFQYSCTGECWKLRSDLPGAAPGFIDNNKVAKRLGIRGDEGFRIPLPALEVDESVGTLNVIESVKDVEPLEPPSAGAQTTKFRFLHSEYGDHKLVLTAEGLAGSSGIVTLYRHGHFVPKVQPEASGTPAASISFRSCDADPYACTSLPLILNFPPGEGWKTITVTLSW
jgi:hypothetical protein